MTDTKQLIIELPSAVADKLEQKAAEAKLPLQAIIVAQLYMWLVQHEGIYETEYRCRKCGNMKATQFTHKITDEGRFFAECSDCGSTDCEKIPPLTPWAKPGHRPAL
jgi:hypothetical protein